LSRNLFIEYVLSYILIIIINKSNNINEKFQNYDTTGHLLYLLFKLNELTLGYFHHSLILIGHQPFYQLPQMNQIEAELGVLTPITIFVPAYTRTEIITILQNILARMKEIYFYTLGSRILEERVLFSKGWGNHRQKTAF